MEHQGKVWLITGSGNGLGRDITEAALKEGHIVVATARNKDQLNDLVNQFDGQIFAAVLDVTNEQQAKEVVNAAIEKFGTIDVLVNNAGYGDNRPFEQTPAEDFRRLVETCFFGVVTLSREVIPYMRKQRSGHIITISSVGGRFATPGNAAYHAAKWAVGGFTESLALETSPFNVKVTALEPGGMRTNWGKRAFMAKFDILPEYKASVGALIKSLEAYWGTEPIDPLRVAEVVMRIAEADQLPAHILLGAEVYTGAKQVSSDRWRDADAWKEVSEYVNFAGPKTFPDLRF